MSERTLSEIWIYPIKSFGGIRLKQARVLPKGLEHDRRWMLIDEAGRFITQREHPAMALFQLTMQGNQLTITSRRTSAQLSIPLSAPTGQAYPCVVWDDAITALEPSARWSSWFSNQLGFTCRLVFFPEENVRAVDPKYVANNEQVSLADGYPYLLIGQSSLDDLNSRLKTPVEMQRFRPNFVVAGGVPYEEDTWKEFEIGTLRFKGIKRCARCVLTTVNPATAEKGPEPLFTLSRYRKEGNKIFFGQNVIALRDNQFVREGDEITLL
ncbi:MAG: MOSC domain-containing protein [Cytophagales bacterium]|nr:MOSC domain-containing protein [Cytophagales bacterium]